MKQEFMQSKRLKEHIHFLVRQGSIYLVYNNNLLMHSCVPCDKNGNFTEIQIGDKLYSGKELYDILSHTPNNDFFVDFAEYIFNKKRKSMI